MCGITGIVNNDSMPVEKNVLRKMAAILSHRGPDDEGFYFNRKSGACQVGLAHRRLSIIDVATGRQPLSNEDGTVWIVFNGEIYNYLPLRQELQQKGHTFRTNSDTEAIVHAYEEWNESCATHLRGMFAFAIWDEKNQRLFLARDRLGIKPLYYYWNPNRFVFGSELKAIMAAPEVTKQIDLQALYDYFTLLYIPAPKSIFSNIFKLPAGHTLTLDKDKNPQVKEYWDLAFQPEQGVSSEEWQERIIEKLKESVEIRLMSEVPLGAFLSGGVDSSAVVAMMAGILDKPVQTASIGFTEKKFNELPYAKQVAELFKTNHYEKIVHPDAVDVLDKLVWFYDEPFADSSSIPTYYVSEAARQKVTVCLSGDGGDENFAGYRRYYFDQLENRLRNISPNAFRNNIIGGLARIYPKLDWAPQVFRAKTLLTNLAMDPAEGFFNSMSWFNDIRSQFINQDFKTQLAGYSSLEVFEEHFRQAPDDPLSAIQYVDMKTYMVDDILTKVDRASMAHSLEVRVPILDHEFMELAAQIPSNLKLKGREGKYIFKKSLEPSLPHDILYRSKMGFSIPLSKWFKNELKPVFEDTVLGTTSLSAQHLNITTVKQIWQEHQAGNRERSPELWSILFFEKWLREWM